MGAGRAAGEGELMCTACDLDSYGSRKGMRTFHAIWTDVVCVCWKRSCGGRGEAIRTALFSIMTTISCSVELLRNIRAISCSVGGGAIFFRS